MMLAKIVILLIVDHLTSVVLKEHKTCYLLTGLILQLK